MKKSDSSIQEKIEEMYSKLLDVMTEIIDIVAKSENKRDDLASMQTKLVLFTGQWLFYFETLFFSNIKKEKIGYLDLVLRLIKDTVEIARKLIDEQGEGVKS